MILSTYGERLSELTAFVFVYGASQANVDVPIALALREHPDFRTNTERKPGTPMGWLLGVPIYICADGSGPGWTVVP